MGCLLLKIYCGPPLIKFHHIFLLDFYLLKHVEYNILGNKNDNVGLAYRFIVKNQYTRGTSFFGLLDCFRFAQLPTLLHWCFAGSPFLGRFDWLFSLALRLTHLHGLLDAQKRVSPSLQA